MKKLLSILMLFIMLIVGVGPTVGMHFCGSSLHSIEIFSDDKSMSCCSQSANDKLAHGECVVIHTDCCDTQEVQIVTDSFQLQERAINVANVFFTFAKDWLSTNVLLCNVEFDSTSLIRKYFPPNGYDAKGLDVLSFICILRI